MTNSRDSRPQELIARLSEFFQPLESIAVAFSGGVDSTVVCAAAVKMLGRDRVLAVTADSKTLPARELDAAVIIAREIGVEHAIIRTGELENKNFAANDTDRCYYCKSELWHSIRKLAAGREIKHLADGTNADDTGDHRPGIQAGDEAGVLHPLAVIGAGKADVRMLAQALGLTNWDKPAQACLSSRFPYGHEITAAALGRVEQAEAALMQMGLMELRVRNHGDIARIEVPEDSLADLVENGKRRELVARFKELGYVYVTLDLEGFRSGSMNEPMPKA